MGYVLLYGALAIWVFFNAKSRNNSMIWWPLSTFVLGPIVLPAYLTNRNLKEGEVREGGKGWNYAKYFALLWTVTMIVGAFAGLGGASESINQAATDAEKAGAAIGTTIGLGLIIGLWFVVTTAVLLVGVFLKKNSVVEKGPTGPLAEESSEGRVGYEDGTGSA